MYTYEVGLYATHDTKIIIEAEYFAITENGLSGHDAYFYVTQRGTPLFPEESKPIMVGFVNRPRYVRFDDGFAYVPAGQRVSQDHIRLVDLPGCLDDAA